MVAFVTHPADFTGALEIITNRPAFQDVLVAEQRLGTTQSNGSFVVDTDTQGVPVTLREKLIATDAGTQRHQPTPTLVRATGDVTEPHPLDLHLF